MRDISEQSAQVYYTRLSFSEPVIDYVENYMGFTLMTFRGVSPEELRRNLIAVRTEIDVALKRLEEKHDLGQVGA